MCIYTYLNEAGKWTAIKTKLFYRAVGCKLKKLSHLCKLLFNSLKRVNTIIERSASYSFHRSTCILIPAMSHTQNAA